MEGTLGNPEVQTSELRLYPNPAIDKLNLTIKDAAFPVSVSVFNTLGQAVINREFKSQDELLNMDVGTLSNRLDG